MAQKSVKKIMEESKSRGYEEIDLQDKSITNVADIPHLCKLVFYFYVCSMLLKIKKITSKDHYHSFFFSFFAVQMRNLSILTLSHNRIQSK